MISYLNDHVYPIGINTRFSLVESHKSTATVKMRSTLALLIGLAAFIQAYAIEKGYDEDIPKGRGSILRFMLPPSELLKETRSSSSTENTLDDSTGTGPSNADAAIMVVSKLRALLEEALDEQRSGQSMSAGERIVEFLRTLKYIIVSEIDNLIKLIDDGRYEEKKPIGSRYRRPQMRHLNHPKFLKRTDTPKLPVLPLNARMPISNTFRALTDLINAATGDSYDSQR